VVSHVRAQRRELSEPQQLNTSTAVRCLVQVIHSGMQHRHVGSHALNIESSRSHSLMTIHCHALPSDPNAWDHGTARCGKICFVDLAGSERLKVGAGELGSRGQGPGTVRPGRRRTPTLPLVWDGTETGGWWLAHEHCQAAGRHPLYALQGTAWRPVR